MSDTQWILLLIILVVLYLLLEEKSYPVLPFPKPAPPKPKPKKIKEYSALEHLQPRTDIPGYENPGPLLLCPEKKKDYD